MVDPYRSGRYAVDNPDWHEADAPHKAEALARFLRFAGLQPVRNHLSANASQEAAIVLARRIGAGLLLKKRQHRIGRKRRDQRHRQYPLRAKPHAA